MTRVFLHSANLAKFDAPRLPVPQVGADVTYHLYTETEFPPRPKGVSPRLQARIPKIFGWDLSPGYDVYFWQDASLHVAREDAVSWFLDQLGDADFLAFRHPWRATLAEEMDFVRWKIKKSRYLQTRYEGEDLEGLWQYVERQGMLQALLYASTAFCYRSPTPEMQQSMWMWWALTSRYHAIDQVQYTLALAPHRVVVLDEDIYHASHLTFTRAHGHG